MSVRDLFRILRRNLVIVVVCLVAGVAVGGYLALSRPSYYTTHARLFVSSNGSDSTDTLLQNSNLVLDRVPSYATLVNSPLVLSLVAQRLGRPESVDSMAARISATNPLQTALIEITVRDTTPRRAYELAVAVSDVVSDVVPRLETPASGFVPIRITMVSQPELPGRVDLGPAASRLALGVLLGLLLGAVIAVGRELFDARLEGPEQLRTKLNLAPLGVLDGSGKATVQASLPDDAYWASRAGEGYRQLRANLRTLAATGGLRSVLITGPNADDGAATVAQNLAIALGMAKVRVLLVEADLRHPRLAAAFGIGVVAADPAGTDPAENDTAQNDATENSGGLAAVLTGELDVDTAIHSWGDGSLQLLPAGSGAGVSGELLASDAMRDLLGRLEQRFDLVIVTAPPMLEVADAAVLAAQVDGVVFTARSGGTRWNAVLQSVQALYDAQAIVLGAAVLGRSRGAGRVSTDAVPALVAPPVPVAAERVSDGARPVTVSTRSVRRPQRRLPATPQSPATPGAGSIPRQLAPARGVASVNKAVEAVANNRTPKNPGKNPNDSGRRA